jgi:hypothetical protein
MDLSKLPKLSKTTQPQGSQDPPQTPPSATPPPSPPLNYAIPPRSPAIGLAEAWISIGLGVFLLFIFPSTIRYLHSPAAFDQNYPITDGNGNTIPYTQSIIFWTDLGVTVFAGALIIEGIVLAIARKIGLVVFAFAVTVASAVFNVIVIVRAEPINGFPIFCGLGVVILGYMALTQWRIISALRQ